MVKDFFVSFKDNIKGKVTNPFFGTLIVVWIIHNYKFVYTIFNFRASTGLDDRLTFIGTYMESENFIPNILWCIGYALCVLVITYLLLNFSRLIVYFFDKKVTPRIQEMTDDKSIVSRKIYDAEKLEKERMQNRFEAEQKAKLQLQNDYDNLEKKYQGLLKPIVNIDSEDIPVEHSNGQPKLFSTKIERIAEKDNFVEQFGLILGKIVGKQSMPLVSPMLKDLLKMGIVTKGNSADRQGYYKYDLTEDGKVLQELWIEMELEKKEG